MSATAEAKAARCRKCGWGWTPRVPQPVACPNCKQRQWEGKPKPKK